MARYPNRVLEEVKNEREEVCLKCMGLCIDDDRFNIETECSNIDHEEKCKIYAFPEKKWRMSNCPAATHLQPIGTKSGRQRVGQQKQKKKSR